MVRILQILHHDISPCFCRDIFGVGGIVQGVGTMTAGAMNMAAQFDANEKNLQIAREVNDTNKRNTDATNAANRQLAEKQNQWNIQQWNRENEYNKPESQVQRYLDAGINPIYAMSSGGIGNGNAGNVQSAPLANQVAPPPAVGATMQAPVLNPDMLSSAIDIFTKGKQLVNETKKTNVEVEKTASEVEKVNAETQAIKDGNVRAEDLQPFALLQAQQDLAKTASGTALNNAQKQNVITRSATMLMDSQKAYSDILASAIDAETKRFGSTVQARGLQVQAQEAQARIANMSLSQLIDYANKFGIRRQWNKNYASSFSSTEGNTASMHGDASFGTPSLTKGGLDLSFGGSYGASESETYSNDFSRNNGASYTELRSEALEPIQAAFRLLREIQDNPTDISLGRALNNLSSYLSQTVKVAFKNFMSLQSAIQTWLPSLSNPSGQDSY